VERLWFLDHKEVSMARCHERQWQEEYSRIFFFWKKSSAIRLMRISRMYRFSNWQNALTCLTQEPCVPREDAGNPRSVEIARVNYRITEVSDRVIMYPQAQSNKLLWMLAVPGADLRGWGPMGLIISILVILTTLSSTPAFAHWSPRKIWPVMSRYSEREKVTLPKY